MFEFPSRGNKNGVPTIKKKLGKLTVRVLAVSCKVLLASPHRVGPKFHKVFFFVEAAALLHKYFPNEITTNPKRVFQKNSKSTRRETVELENT